MAKISYFDFVKKKKLKPPKPPSDPLDAILKECLYCNVCKSNVWYIGRAQSDNELKFVCVKCFLKY